jgi:hypothetical protein
LELATDIQDPLDDIDGEIFEDSEEKEKQEDESRTLKALDLTVELLQYTRKVSYYDLSRLFH